jgi:hypothetical protein
LKGEEEEDDGDNDVDGRVVEGREVVVVEVVGAVGVL